MRVIICIGCILLLISCRDNKIKDAYLKKNYKKVIEETNLVQQDLKNIDIIKIRASSYYNLKLYDKSVKDYSFLVRVEPNNFETKFNLAYSLYKLNLFESSICYFKELASSFKINSINVFYPIADCYMKLNKIDSAIIYYNYCISIDTNYIYAYNDRGICYQLKGKFDSSIYDFNKSLTSNKNQYELYYNLSASYYYLYNYKKSLEYIDKAINLLNENQSKTHLGKFYYSKLLILYKADKTNFLCEYIDSCYKYNFNEINTEIYQYCR